jgi:hypothetical protein
MRNLLLSYGRCVEEFRQGRIGHSVDIDPLTRVTYLARQFFDCQMSFVVARPPPVARPLGSSLFLRIGWGRKRAGDSPKLRQAIGCPESGRVFHSYQNLIRDKIQIAAMLWSRVGRSQAWRWYLVCLGRNLLQAGAERVASLPSAFATRTAAIGQWELTRGSS